MWKIYSRRICFEAVKDLKEKELSTKIKHILETEELELNNFRRQGY